MKILLLKCGNICYDGVTIMLLNLMENMKRDDMEIWLYANGSIEDQILADRFSDNGIILVTGNQEKLSEKKTAADISKLCRNEKFDIVHCHTGNIRYSGIAMMAVQSSCRAIRIAHSHNSNGDNPYYSVQANALRKVNRELANVHMACSEVAGEHLFGQGCKTILLKNGIDISEFSYNEDVRAIMRQQLGLSDELLIGNVGKLSGQKNQEFLINILAELRKKNVNAKLLILGEGELRMLLEAQINKLGLTEYVIMPGVSDHVNTYLQAMDVFVMTSRYEGLPVVAVEAQAAGLPVLLSDVITRECAITENTAYVSLKEKPLKWADEVLRLSALPRKNTDEEITAAGFNIRSSASRLKHIYVKAYEKLHK